MLDDYNRDYARIDDNDDGVADRMSHTIQKLLQCKFSDKSASEVKSWRDLST